jgi:hypothetical protein
MQLLVAMVDARLRDGMPPDPDPGSGWRMRDTFMDSGFGHGDSADVWFELPVHVQPTIDLIMK